MLPYIYTVDGSTGGFNKKVWWQISSKSISNQPCHFTGCLAKPLNSHQSDNDWAATQSALSIIIVYTTSVLVKK
jgi:hypothetical protein